MADAAAEPRAFRAALRARLIAAREALPPALHAELSRRIERHLAGLLEALAPAVLAFCWPHRGEFDARALVAARIEGGLRACLPIVVDSGLPLEFREWAPASEMMAGRYGIPVPAGGARLRPDAILMPLNAFDASGCRLGYGGGYFDRSLAALAPRPRAVGVGFELARVDSLDPQPHDQPMDFIVTEAGAFERAAGRLRPFAPPRQRG